MKVRFTKDLYPYKEGEVIEMRDDLARGQNAEYVEEVGDKVALTDFSKESSEVTVTMGKDEVEQMDVTKKPEAEEEQGVHIQLDADGNPVKDPETEGKALDGPPNNKSMANKNKSNK